MEFRGFIAQAVGAACLLPMLSQEKVVPLHTGGCPGSRHLLELPLLGSPYLCRTQSSEPLTWRLLSIADTCGDQGRTRPQEYVQGTPPLLPKASKAHVLVSQCLVSNVAMLVLWKLIID